MNLLMRDIRRLFLAVLVLVGLWATCYWAGFRINLTPSVPVGVYQLHKLEGPLKRGDIVWFCPPDTPLFRKVRDEWGDIPHGDCPGGYMHMFKPVAALPGDAVELTRQGVFVNGQLLPNSRPMNKTGKGQKLNPIFGRFMVQPGTVWLVSSYHPQSFDSRYFGPVSNLQLGEIARPVQTYQ
jgi:conjugative transfer signal peptidase TraF